MCKCLLLEMLLGQHKNINGNFSEMFPYFRPKSIFVFLFFFSISKHNLQLKRQLGLIKNTGEFNSGRFLCFGNLEHLMVSRQVF